jgi:serine/threonine protein kinase/tetratricopeptide (TPR) repeat protein
MDEEVHHQVEVLFQQAADLPPEQRPAFLSEHCQGVPRLRLEVERLLDKLERPLLRSLASVDRQDACDASLAGQQIGPYRLERLLGEGGFSLVYLATQQTPVCRQVALKIIKVGMDTRQVVARFATERQALALMDHPNIATVFDAGLTEAGRSYFVMEYVCGAPITEYCDERRLSIRQRVELFRQVCGAVQHAHTKGIIHRDLKPSNVLVSTREQLSIPKVIDFGIAKATSGPLQGGTELTRHLQLLGTPEYMSPEQARLDTVDVDARTDVYSLGALLYELLTGATPLCAASLATGRFDDVQRAICEDAIPAPSRRLGTLGAQLEHVAGARDTEPSFLRRSLRRDLDWIVMKALEKDRTRRYETPAQLAEDLTCYLQNQPVSARPPSRSYRLRKFAGRNRVVVAAGLLVAAALLTGFVVSAIGFTSARAEARATREVNALLNDIISSIDPMRLRSQSAYVPVDDRGPAGEEGAAPEASLADMVQQASKRIDETFARRPALAAGAHETIGMTLRGLGRYAQAEPELRAALALHQDVYGEDHPDTLRCMLALGDVLFERGQAEEGEPFARAAVEGLRRAHGDRHPRTLSAETVLAAIWAERGRYDEAEALFEAALASQRELLGPEHRDGLTTLWRWSLACLVNWRLTKGQKLARELNDVAERTLSPDDSLRILSETLMGWWHSMLRRYREAEPLLRSGLVHCRRVLGGKHPFTYMTMEGLGRSLQGSNVQVEKERLLRQALLGLQATRGDSHWQTLASMTALAVWLDQRGTYEEAEQLYRRLVAGYTAVAGEEDVYTLRHLASLAELLYQVGRFDEALAVRRRRLDVLSRHIGTRSAVTWGEMDRLAEELLRCGRIDAAHDVTRRLTELVHDAAAERPNDANLLNTCAWLLLNCDPVAMRDAPAAVALAERSAELSNWESGLILDTLALGYYRAGDTRRALAIQRKALEVASPESPHCVAYYARLIHYLQCTGDTAAAEGCVAKAVAQHRASLGEDNSFLAANLHDTGVIMAEEGRFELAEALLREALVVYRERLGERHELTAACLVDLANTMAEQNQYRRSIEIGRMAVEVHRELWNEDDLRLARALHAWGVTLRAAGEADRARQALREALAIFRGLDLENVPAALRLKRHLAEACFKLGQPGEAERLADDVLNSTEALFGKNHLDTVLAMKTHGLALIHQERPQRAEALLRTAVSLCRALELSASQSWRLAEIRGILGHCLARQGRYAEAEALLAKSYQTLCDARGTDFYPTRRAAGYLAYLYEAQGRPADAAAWRARTTTPGSADD